MALRRKSALFLSMVALLALVLTLGACARQAAKPAPATPAVPAAQPAKETPKAQATATPEPKQAAPAAQSYTNLIGKLDCPLCARGLAETHPLIAKYHWSKLPNPAGQKPKYGGIVRSMLQYDPSNWDPFTGNTGTYVWGNLVYSNLMRANMRLTEAFKNPEVLRQLIAECDVCESWKQTSPTQYTFKIRPDAHWQNVPPLNGRPLTAEDIKYAYDKYLDPKAFQQYAIFQGVDSIQTPDKQTLVINLKYPHAGFVDAITHPAFYIFSREAYERQGGLVVAPPLGSGFMLFEQHVPQNRLSMKRNPDYWKKDEYGQQLPYLDGVQLTFMPDIATQVAAFRTGQIDNIIFFAWDPSQDLLRTEKLGENAYLRVMEQNSGGTRIWFMQMKNPQFTDVRVRRALSLALDRQAMIKRALGEGYCAPGPIPTWWMGRDYPPKCDDLGLWNKYDPAQARALLQQAGFTDQKPLTFTFHGGGAGGTPIPSDQAMMETALEYWKAVGVQATIKPWETTALQRYFRGREFEGVVLSGVGIGTDLDAFAWKLHTKGPENYANISDPELDKLIEAQRAEFDLQKRKAIAKQISEQYLDQVWHLLGAQFYFSEWTKAPLRNWVTHDLYYYIHGWGAFAIETAWMDK